MELIKNFCRVIWQPLLYFCGSLLAHLSAVKNTWRLNGWFDWNWFIFVKCEFEKQPCFCFLIDIRLCYIWNSKDLVKPKLTWKIFQNFSFRPATLECLAYRPKLTLWKISPLISPPLCKISDFQQLKNKLWRSTHRSFTVIKYASTFHFSSISSGWFLLR